MALYTYKCEKGHTFELRQPMGADPVRECAICHGQVRRVVSPVGIVFKGSGFYVTDNRNGKSNGGVTASNGNAKTKSETSSESAETKGAETKSSAASTTSPAPTAAD
jgi:putative FmdB family regulatory protein